MRVAHEFHPLDFAMSDLVCARPVWSDADLDQASQSLDLLIHKGRDTERALFYKAQIRELKGDFAGAASWLDRMALRGPGEPIAAYDFDRYCAFSQMHAERTRLLATYDLDRPVYLAALPKAAGSFLTHCLSHLTGALRVRTAKGLWGKGSLVPSWVDTLVKGAGVAHDHFPASAENVRILKRLPEARITVHVRHPADALAELVRDLAGQKANQNLHYLYARELGQPYFHLQQELPEAQLDWIVRTIYPAFVSWLEGWLATADYLRDMLTFTRFEDLATDPPGIIAVILDHAGYDPYGLPALDGGERVPLDTAVATFEQRFRRNGDSISPASTRHLGYADVFPRAHCDFMARYNTSPLFHAFDFAPVDPSLARI